MGNGKREWEMGMPALEAKTTGVLYFVFSLAYLLGTTCLPERSQVGWVGLAKLTDSFPCTRDIDLRFEVGVEVEIGKE